MTFTEFIISILSGGFGIVQDWGYLGAFVVSFLGNAFIFPFPIFIMIFTFGAILNPFLLALFSALGSAIGSTTSYLIGLGSKEVLERKYEDKIIRMKETFNKYGSFWWILIVELTPIPDNLISYFCGIVRYDYKKYLFAAFIGKLILSLIVAYAGYLSLNAVIEYLNIESYFIQP